MKRALLCLMVFGLLLSLALPAWAGSFSGMVLDATVYGLIVKSGSLVKIFQIRPETTGERDLHPQDLVKVDFREENGALVATRIKLLKRYQP